MWLNWLPQNITNNVPALGLYGVFQNSINPNLPHVLNLIYRGDGKYAI